MAQEPTLYEAVYILDAELSEEDLERAINNLHQYVENTNGEVVSDELFGRRRLAYEIDHHNEGIYRIMYFHGDDTTIRELRHEFGLMEQVIRSMVVVANPDAIFKVREPARPTEEEASAAEDDAELAAPQKPEDDAELATQQEPEGGERVAPTEEAETDEEIDTAPVAQAAAQEPATQQPDTVD